MKEYEFIQIIKNTLKSEYIGDDCAYLKDLGIAVTQDSLVENIHFSRKFISPFQLGYKSAAVNISDICASGAEPAYMTISLSLPDNVEKDFVKEFYEGAKKACGNVKIVGGDITGSDKIYISVTAIGKTDGRKISSRKNAKAGQKIVVSGLHGSSGAGLQLLSNGKTEPKKFIDAHLTPQPQCEFSKKIASSIKEDYAMMDTSDGLMDALLQIAEQSGVKMCVDFENIPYDIDLKMFDNFMDLILYGGEDYGIVATVAQDETHGFAIIGEVKKGSGVELSYKNGTETFSRNDIEKKLYSHFKEKL